MNLTKSIHQNNMQSKVYTYKMHWDDACCENNYGKEKATKSTEEGEMRKGVTETYLQLHSGSKPV